MSMKLLLIFSVWISAFLITLFSFFYSLYTDFPGLVLTGALTAILILLMGIMFPMLIMYSLSSAHYKNLSTLMDKQVRAQVAHYEAMSKMNEDIRRFRHDYKNLHLGLIDFLKRGDTAGALNYLKADEMSLESLAGSYVTGSVIMDALLSEKQAMGTGANVSIDFDGFVPDSLISPADICVIFGNALDNALEACAKLPVEEKKTVSIQTKVSFGHLFIKIENPTGSNLKITNNNISTTKENKRSHGFGLISMQSAVEKYSGDIKLSCEYGIFCVEIVLYVGQ